MKRTVSIVLAIILGVFLLTGCGSGGGGDGDAGGPAVAKPEPSQVSGSALVVGKTVTVGAPGQEIEVTRDQKISLRSPDGGDIYYTLDGTDPTADSAQYDAPITIDSKVTLKAIAVVDGSASDVMEVRYTTTDIAVEERGIPLNGISYYPLADVPGVIVEKGLWIPVSDDANGSVQLHANVYRPDPAVYPPDADGKYPVIFSMTPYDINEFDIYDRFDAPSALWMNWNLGEYHVSDHTIFEGPDPGYWVPEGYAVVTVDARGMGESYGYYSDNLLQAKDWGDIMNWADEQGWGNGNYAIHGVSALVMNQWNVLSRPELVPPQYKAAVAWAGINETGAGMNFGGIPEIGFGRFVGTLMKRSGNAGTPPEDGSGTVPALYNLDVMNVPVLVCGSFSDQEIHDRDSFEAYIRMITPAEDKYIYNHRVAKWEEYYSPEALEVQKMFLAKYLKGEEDAMDDVAHVRYQVNEDRDNYRVYYADDWPIPGTEDVKKYLDASSGLLVKNSPSAEATVEFTPEQEADAFNSAVFSYTFEEDTNVVGYMKLRLWVELQNKNGTFADLPALDLDVFVGIQKLDANGDIVYMINGESGAELFRPVALGWQRASSRALNEDPKYQPLNPVRLQSAKPAEFTPQYLNEGEIVPLDIAIMPSGTLFKAGETLRVVVQSQPIEPVNSVRIWDCYKEGTTVLYAGGAYDSSLEFQTVK